MPIVTPRRKELAEKRARGLTAQREAAALRTHCARGHEFTEANTRFDKHGSRHCRMCHRGEMNAKHSVECSRCSCTYLLSTRNARSVLNGDLVGLCPICRWLPEIVVADEHIQFWRDGGDGGRLSWEEVLSIAADVDGWFQGRLA